MQQCFQYKSLIDTLRNNAISIDPDSLFMDEKCWFMGNYFSLIQDGKVIISIKARCLSPDGINDYRQKINNIFRGKGELLSAAMYRMANGQQIIVPNSKKRYYIIRSHIDAQNLPNNKPFCLNTYSECSTITEEQKRYCFLAAINSQNKDKQPVAVVVHIPEPSLLPKAMYMCMVSLIQEHGTMVSGEIFKNSKNGFHYLKVEQCTPQLKPQLLGKTFILQEDYYRRRKIMNGEFKNSIMVFAGNRQYQKLFSVGDSFNPDWFGREKGFFIKDQNQVVEFKSFY